MKFSMVPQVQYELYSAYCLGMNTNNLDQRVEFHSPLEFGYAVFENILLSSGMYFL